MKVLICFILAILFIHNAYSKAEVKDAFFKVNSEGQFNLNIVTDEKVRIQPQITVRDNLLQVEIKNAIVWPKINKQMKVDGETLELSVYQFDKNKVRLRVTYPKNRKISLSKVKKEIKRKYLSYRGVVGDLGDLKRRELGVYDESYLNKLIKERETISAKVSLDQTNIKKNKMKEDQVKLSYSSPVKNSSRGKFNVWAYAAKFIGFLILMIGGIYSAFFFLKKGAVKKNKLGFLNTDKQIEVVSKHFLSPKRNLILVKVHQQVFLVANHENGVEFLSEIKEPGKVLRDMEMEVVGDSFDSKLDSSKDKPENELKIKEDINFSHPDEEDSLTNKLRKKIKATRDIQ